MEFYSDDVAKVIMAIAVGGLIGGEREFRDKAAGIRTNIFICVGSTLFTIFSIKLSGGFDPARIAANIVTGIGFLGAGAIMRDRGKITGLTTASTIWIVSALGMGIGAGDILFTAATTLIIIIVLLFFPAFDSLLRDFRDTKNYQIVCDLDNADETSIEKSIFKSGLQIRSFKREKRGPSLIFTWEAYGSPKKHRKLAEIFLEDSKIKEFLS